MTRRHSPGRNQRLRGTALSTAEIAGRAAVPAAGWPGGPTPSGQGSAYVLVGGAGFRGSRIAARLLAEPGDVPVVVVSRRLNAVAWQASPRLVLVAADITLDGREWMARIPRAGVVFHLAASVHALAGWDTLEPVNLNALGASVALAERDGALLQLASTLSVFVSSNGKHADVEEKLPERRDL
ncbi:MAG: NAD-dependent epimerase/dehydratase family protein [Janthinobacterium lividum]